jgi:prepilin peptidase CpaA
MNLVLGAPIWLLGLLLVALLAAVIEDAIRLRISNPTCVAVFALAIVAMVVHGFELALWQNAVVFVVILALGTLAFGAGWLGGGDVKLLAALGLWVDFRGAMLLLAGTFIAGGVIAIIYLAARMVVPRRDKARERRIPYGLAIATGALIVFGLQGSKPAKNAYIEKLKAAQHR